MLDAIASHRVADHPNRANHACENGAPTVAIARKLLAWMWHLVRRGETYRSPAQAA